MYQPFPDSFFIKASIILSFQVMLIPPKEERGKVARFFQADVMAHEKENAVNLWSKAMHRYVPSL